MHGAALYGYQELAEILLGNGAKVNAAMEVVSDVLGEEILRIKVQHIVNKRQSMGMALVMPDSIKLIVHG